MKILFAIVDGGGNVPPQLGTARALRARGVEILVLGHPGIRTRVEAAGLPFQSFTGGAHFDPTVPRSLAAIMATFTRVAADKAVGRCIVEAASTHRVDAVVVDMILSASIPEIEKSGIPTIVFVHCFYRAVQDLVAGPVGWVLRLRGTDPLAAEHGGLLQVVAARADLDPVRGKPPVRHVGVVWQGVPAVSAPAEVPRILVSLSTCGFPGQRRMLQNILDAVAPLPVEATVTVGPGIDAAGLRVPQNATMHAWLDHDDVLATASLVVGHGGHSTAMRALSFGVPQVTMPANPMIDQKAVGAALQKAGSGILLPKHAKPQRIRAAIETVLGDRSYRRAANRLGEQIRQRDGAEVAADAISEYVADRQFAPS
ncbi:glycosyltransferase [Mycobacterium sp. 1274761.0]|uniref:glycosyltransferase n=1 Tax=Mycobacterium sp. 1274761.0 TaxID=1834077 RepID=UPI000801BD27|nr:nucleotide disphospho-sugar-binding domain-containing protein [Mycobacterium sp. 1274761.0]OBK70560.1 UDP-glucuronosyltransferase [Mycobacterium sp. 1274761.0]